MLHSFAAVHDASLAGISISRKESANVLPSKQCCGKISEGLFKVSTRPNAVPRVTTLVSACLGFQACLPMTMLVTQPRAGHWLGKSLVKVKLNNKKKKSIATTKAPRTTTIRVEWTEKIFVQPNADAMDHWPGCQRGGGRLRLCWWMTREWSATVIFIKKMHYVC